MLGSAPRSSPHRVRASPYGIPRLAWFFLILLSLAISGKSGDAQDADDPVTRYLAIPGEDHTARLDLIAEDPKAFEAAYVAALHRVDLADTDWRPNLETAALDYLEAAEDSLLLSDYRFVVGATPELREAWYQAVQVNASAFELRGEEEHEASAKAFSEAAEAYGRIGHLRREAVAWGWLGVASWFSGDPDGVVAAYTKALVARKRLGDPVLIGRTLNGLGSINLHLDNYAVSLAYYKQAVAVREPLNRPVDLGTSVVYMGNVYYRMGDLDQAHAHYLRGLDILGPDAPERILQEARGSLTNVYADLGEYERALALYRQELEVAEARDDLEMATDMRSRMAEVLIDLGRYDEALKELTLVEEIHKGEENVYELSRTVNAMSVVYLNQGDATRALQLSRRAETLAKESQNEMVRAHALLNTAKIYVQMGLFDKAMESYEELMVVWKDMESDGGVRDVLLAKANLLWEKRDLDGALDYYTQALSMDEALGNRTNLPMDYHNLGNVLTEIGRTEEGLRAYEKGISLAQELGERETVWRGYLGIADTHERAREFEKAREYNQKAIEAMETLRSRRLSEETNAAVLGGRSFVYEAQVHILGKLYNQNPDPGVAAEAFMVAEAGKARALLDILAEADIDLDVGMDADLLARRDRLDLMMSSAQYQLRQSDTPSDSVRVLKQRIRGLQQERGALLTRLRLENPRFAAMDVEKPKTLKDIQSSLLENKDDLVLEYSLGDSASYLWAITWKGVEFHRLPPKTVLESQVQKLRSGLLNPTATGDEVLISAAVSLYQDLLSPVASLIQNNHIVYIIPDGALHFLPFDVLLTRAPKTEIPTDAASRNQFFGKLSYVFMNTQVRYGPSATTLAILKENRVGHEVPEVKEFLGLGAPTFYKDGDTGTGSRDLAPLPHTLNEVETIGAFFDGNQKTVLVADAAREKTLEEPGFLAGYRILHFATHGLIDERRPEQSSLALAYPRDPTEDGFLRASEIYGLRLNADLVVLSACETGLGQMVRGEGVMGLPRAFFFSGAGSVVVSLWSVSDESTSELMTGFYKGMTQGNHAAVVALAQAKSQLRKSANFAHPFYWAPFVMMGPG